MFSNSYNKLLQSSSGYGMLRQTDDLYVETEEKEMRTSSQIPENSPISERISADFTTIEIRNDSVRSELPISKLNTAKAFRRMFNELMNPTERALFYFVLFCTFCCSALRLISFIFIAGIIDLLAGTYNSDLHNICNIHEFINCDSYESLIHVFAVTLIIASLFASLFTFTRDTLTSMAICSFLKRLNCIVFDQVMNQNLSFFECGVKNTQELRYLLTNSMADLKSSLHDAVIVIESLMHFLCGIMYLLIISLNIALILLVSFILLSIISVIYIKKNEKVNSIRVKTFNIVTQSVVEMLNYMATIKTFSKEEDESYFYKQCIYRAYDHESSTRSLLYAYSFWMNNVVYLTVLSVIWHSAFLIYHRDASSDTNNITLGVLFIALFIFVSLNWSIYNIAILAPQLVTKCSQSLFSMFDIIDINIDKQKEKKDSYIPPNHTIANGSIVFKNVSFWYPNNKNKIILNNINMEFLPSTTTALVGVSGSGKSTILKLLMRFFDFESGCILIDGIDIGEYNLAFLHSQIGYVGHIVDLFENRTICENIKFGLKVDRKHRNLFDAEYFDEENMYFWRQFKSITQSEVETAAKMANAHEFIMETEHGYDTKIGGENGIQLSHGQKQRIGIARALLLDPKVLLLDEAMAAVDGVSKRLIQQSLDRIMDGRYVIVIAHRLKTVQNANRIYVIKNGEIVGDGLHAELIENNNHYYTELTQNDNEIYTD